MARPINSIANVKLPGENTQRPIVPYAVGVNANNTAQAVLPVISADDTIAVGTMIAAEYDDGSLSHIRYAKGDYCKKDGFLYRAKETTYGTWDASKWEKVDIASQLNLFQYGTYSSSDYGYNESSGAVSLLIPKIVINKAEDHEDYMVDFSVREGSSPNWSFYSTKIYPGRITLNGEDVVTQPEIADFVTGPESAENNNIALFDGTTGKIIKSNSNIKYQQAVAKNGIVLHHEASGVETETFYHTRGVSVNAWDESHDVSYEYLYPNKSGTFALTNDLPQIDDLTEL